jgi:hypothetical protein
MCWSKYDIGAAKECHEDQIAEFAIHWRLAVFPIIPGLNQGRNSTSLECAVKRGLINLFTIQMIWARHSPLVAFLAEVYCSLGK